MTIVIKHTHLSTQALEQLLEDNMDFLKKWDAFEKIKDKKHITMNDEWYLRLNNRDHAVAKIKETIHKIQPLIKKET